MCTSWKIVQFLQGVKQAALRIRIRIRIRIHRIHMFLGLQDPDTDPLVVWIRILLSSFKNIKRNLDSYYFATLFDILSLKNDANVPSKSNKQNIFLNYLFVGILKVNDENSRIRIQDPDPLVRGMDLRIRIYTKMSWIHNTT